MYLLRDKFVKQRKIVPKHNPILPLMLFFGIKLTSRYFLNFSVELVGLLMYLNNFTLLHSNAHHTNPAKIQNEILVPAKNVGKPQNDRSSYRHSMIAERILISRLRPFTNSNHILANSSIVSLRNRFST